MNVFERFQEAFRVFRGRDRPTKVPDWSSPNEWGNGNQVTQFGPAYGNGGGWNGYGPGPVSSDRPDRVVLKPGSERSIVNAVYNRIALDVASIEFHHAEIDESDSFKKVIKGSVEDALTVEANIDQTAMAYMIDLVISMFEEGTIVELPAECDRDDDGTITDKLPLQLRLGKVVHWTPKTVRVEAYNELMGRKEEIEMDKREVCIIENPFFSVMNQNNSIYRRLIRKMAIMDIVNEKLGSDKLNLIMQLPAIVRTDAQRKTANARLEELEAQLGKSKLGIGYVDNTEKIIQLNRPIENNLQSQIEWLTDLFFSQLCITKEILNGTADEKTMANYMNRCIGVICTAIAQERRRKLLTPAQRKDNQSIVFVQDPLKLIPVTNLADIFDKLTRNAILSPNECRGAIGYKPSDDEAANQLVNRNMPIKQTPEGAEGIYPEDESQEFEHSDQPRLNRNQRRRLARQKKKENSE